MLLLELDADADFLGSSRGFSFIVVAAAEAASEMKNENKAERGASSTGAAACADADVADAGIADGGKVLRFFVICTGGRGRLSVVGFASHVKCRR